MMKAAEAGRYLGLSARKMYALADSGEVLSAAESAEVDAELERALPWAQEFAANVRGSGYAQHLAAKQTKHIARRNAASASRHAAKLQRTPAWANQALTRAIYERARHLTESTGTEHHVDHFYPLQGRLVSGLHVHTNLQILTGPENCRKNNRYEIEE